MHGFLHTRFHVPTAFPPVEVWKKNELMFFAGVFKMFFSTVRVAQNESVANWFRITIIRVYLGVRKPLNLSGGSTRLHPGRPRNRQLLWTAYLEQSEGDPDRWTDTCSGGREKDIVMMLLLCDNVSENYLWPIYFHYPSTIFVLEVPRSIMISCGVFHHGSSSRVVALTFVRFTFFTQSRDEHDTGDCRQCKVPDVR